MGQTVGLVIIIGAVSLGSQLGLTAMRARLERRRRHRERQAEAMIDLREPQAARPSVEEPHRR